MASRRVENSFQVALVVSVMFLVTLTVLNKVKMQEAFQNLSMEHFNLMGTMQNIMQGQQQEEYTVNNNDASNPIRNEPPDTVPINQTAPTAKFSSTNPIPIPKVPKSPYGLNQYTKCHTAAQITGNENILITCTLFDV